MKRKQRKSMKRLLKAVKKPLFYFQLSGTSLYRTLFQMKVDHNIDIERISLDTLDEDEIMDAYRELEIPFHNLHINRHSLREYLRQEYVDFHLNLFRQGLIEAAITAVNSVYEELEKMIPVFKIAPTVYSMREAFNFISSFIETQKAKNNQIIVQVIDVKNYSRANHPLAMYEKQEKKLALYQKLIQYAKEYYACVFPAEGEEFIIFITKGIFQEYTNFYEEVPFVSEIEDELGISLVVGIGMGENALEAEKNARTALKLAASHENSCTFVVDQGGEVIGPIGSSDQKKYQFKSDDGRLMSLAEKTSFSVTTLSQILNIMKRLGRDTLTSDELHEGLGVTLRTANRIMARLYEVGLAQKVGYEQPGRRGRPRQIYRLKLEF